MKKAQKVEKGRKGTSDNLLKHSFRHDTWLEHLEQLDIVRLDVSRQKGTWLKIRSLHIAPEYVHLPNILNSNSHSYRLRCTLYCSFTFFKQARSPFSESTVALGASEVGIRPVSIAAGMSSSMTGLSFAEPCGGCALCTFSIVAFEVPIMTCKVSCPSRPLLCCVLVNVIGDFHQTRSGVFIL